MHAATAGFSSAIILPGAAQIAKEFNVSMQSATYQAGVGVLFLGLGNFVWVPLANAYGRRPVLVSSMFLACLTSLGGSFARSYAQLMLARIVQHAANSSGLVVGSAVVVDIFYPHERGQKTGVWSQMATLGPSFGPLVAGTIIKYHGWRWSLYLTALLNGAQALLYLFTFYETSFAQREAQNISANEGFKQLFRRPKKVNSLGSKAILGSLFFIQSPVVILCTLAYAVTFAIVLIGLPQIVSISFSELYNFGPARVGLVFASAAIGVIIGEQLSGPLSDRLMKHEIKHARETQRLARLEYRLRAALPGFVLAPAGLVIFGITLGK